MEFLSVVPFSIMTGFVAVFGLLVGSFSNVCIYRMPKRESVVFPASHCTACNSPVRAYDNIPVISYLLLGGKCRSCGVKISPMYPAIELIIGLLITLAFLRSGLSVEFAVTATVSAVLVIITVIDFQHRIIPDRITLPGIIFGFAAGFYLEGWRDSLIGFFLGGGLFYLIAVLSRGGMGGGDIKFIAAAGALVGWQKVLLIIFIGALAGSVVGIALMVLKGGTRKSMIPFGPFLALGTLAVLYYGDDLVRYYLSAMQQPF
ncbi:MAG: prepilin peptidase [Nitrospinaceae bacterium]|jgi:leader peptidase (prepilin peptidase)/N-methyltransferase|nr:MAG: prepilin peptidase [Nitrospinaceae bacterium]